MKRFLPVLCLAGALACRSRAAPVQAAPPPPAPAPVAAIQMTNDLGQAVNVYLLNGSANIFLRQVPPNAMLRIPVPGFAPGTTVTLRAATADGSRTFTKENVLLSSNVTWAVP